jgi:hypothetical protein
MHGNRNDFFFIEKVLTNKFSEANNNIGIYIVHTLKDKKNKHPQKAKLQILFRNSFFNLEYNLRFCVLKIKPRFFL